MSKKRTNSEIYDAELKNAPHISSYKQIALNAMFELEKQLKSKKCKDCENVWKNERTDDRPDESGPINEFVSENAN
jgi:hypothetical protein